MMLIALIGHVLVALVLAALAARLRTGRADVRGGALELCTALSLPIFGGAAVLVSLFLETFFRRRTRPVRPRDLLPADAGAGTRPLPGTVDILRVGLDADPLEDLLLSTREDSLERGLQRLARSSSPDALERLKEALDDPRRDVRVRVRSLLVGLEKKLQRAAQASASALERASARRRLAVLAADPSGARQHLDRAADELRAAAKRGFDPGVLLELSSLLLELGELAEARRAADVVVEHRPADVRGYVARLEASFRLGDRAAVECDAATLDRLGGAPGRAG
jgi:hypothetical protein